MADTPSTQKQTKVTGELMFAFVKAIVDAGLEDEFIARARREKFYLSGRARSMKVAADFLRDNADAGPKAREAEFALARAPAEKLMARVCKGPTCDF